MLEQVHLGEVVADVAERRGKAAPDLRMFEHPGYLVAHGLFQVDGIARKLLRNVWLTAQLVVRDLVQPGKNRLMGCTGVLQNVV